MARAKDKEEIILKAAFEVYSKKGYKGASMQDIATHAGLSKGALYDYFKTKEELLIEVIRRKSESSFEISRTFANSKDTMEKMLEAMIVSTQAFISEIDFLFKFLIAGDLFGLSPESTVKLQEVLGKLRERHVAVYREALEQGKIEGIVRDMDLDFAAEAAAELVASYLHISKLKESICGVPRRENPDQIRMKILDMILNGVKA